MARDNVIQLFTRAAPEPGEPEDSPWMVEFIETYLNEFMTAATNLLNAVDEEDMRRWKAEVQEQVSRWP